MRLNKIGYLFKEGFRSVFAHGFMSFASVTIIIACLVIMGSFSLVALNISKLIADFESDNQILVFIDEALTREEAEEIAVQILAVDNVSEAIFITKEQAYEDYKKTFDDPKVLEGIEADILRDRYLVYMNDITKIVDTQARLLAIEGVAKVNVRVDIAQGIITVRNIVSAVSLILVIILVIVSIFIMSNTIKLTTFGRREEIAIMKMVGATNGFIRTPFVIEGLVLGLIGAGIAIFLQWGIYILVSERVMTSIAGSLVSVIAFSDIVFPLVATFAGIGIIVGAFGGIIAIRNYLKV